MKSRFGVSQVTKNNWFKWAGTVAQALDRLRGEDSDDETPPPEGVYS